MICTTEPCAAFEAYFFIKADLRVHFNLLRSCFVAWRAAMNRLVIVWRNPNPAPRKHRWHELACDVGRRLYVVEELVPRGDQKRWAQSLALEVISGRRAVA